VLNYKKSLKIQKST